MTPLDVPQDVRTVVLLGGTFDPPHVGHVRLAERLRERHEPGAALVFVPAAVSPFKAGQAQTSAEHRVAMLRLAISGVENATVWTDEVDRGARSAGAASYTVDTIRRAKEALSGVEMALVIGADQAVAFHRWREHRAILELARVYVLPRGALVTREALGCEMEKSGAWTEEEVEGWKGRLVLCDEDVDRDLARVSSSEVRETISERGVDAARLWVVAGVREYIARHGLYGSELA